MTPTKLVISSPGDQITVFVSLFLLVDTMLKSLGYYLNTCCTIYTFIHAQCIKPSEVLLLRHTVGWRLRKNRKFGSPLSCLSLGKERLVVPTIEIDIFSLLVTFWNTQSWISASEMYVQLDVTLLPMFQRRLKKILSINLYVIEEDIQVLWGIIMRPVGYSYFGKNQILLFLIFWKNLNQMYVFMLLHLFSS